MKVKRITEANEGNQEKTMLVYGVLANGPPPPFRRERGPRAHSQLSTLNSQLR